MGRAQILVVEDDFLIAEDLSDCLRRAGYEVAQPVSTGEEAITKAKESRIDLVMMDVNLAGNMDGIESARRLRNILGIPVVYLTGYSVGQAQLKDAASGASGILGKPFSEEEVLLVVETALRDRNE